MSTSNSNLPFGLSKIFKPITPKIIAKTKLKSNLFLLFLFKIIFLFFPPYLNLKLLLIKIIDKFIQNRKNLREISYSENVFYYFEFLITSVLIFNIIESFISIQYPINYSPEIKQNLILTPSKLSSPLTRSYSPSKIPTTSSQTLQRSIYKSSPISTPIKSSSNQNQNLNISQSSPNSKSPTTVKLFKLSSSSSSSIKNQSPSKSGLFFEEKDKNQQNDNFILIDREEKLWVDNVLKGVRGKSGKIGL
ncbi:uncharacterized protein I206_101600 [Kwoniella pini CBS 10737]|uniref:Uncharacterized protein n=1 Tax=Kwoniella pini CBS 10737 TaxID=1296096 RepID=A0A1B9HW97_9TREE|nr:uncharacterized protein I206_06430 [Kwoniella pini CBS 10737]OCF47529.1 hypothetical protein I206_06430 [Kwoniella pini CBS 10737]